MTGSVKILSIDAWGNQTDGYEWNSWHKVGSMPLDLFEEVDSDSATRDARLLAWMVENGFITQVEGAEITDDQYNYVVQDAATGEPLFAIEYGPAYD